MDGPMQQYLTGNADRSIDPLERRVDEASSYEKVIRPTPSLPSASEGAAARQAVRTSRR